MPAAPDNTLYLIDGHAQIFRAYFAIRGGLNSPITGEPTQAVYGFAQMLIKLFSVYKPRYACMAIDMPGRTFRDELYEAYKGNREKAPTDLESQIPRILDVTRMFGIPILGQSGAEADDIIATIVRRVLADPSLNHVDVRVVSKDKDLMQLLDGRVTLFDIHTDETIDRAWLKEHRGVAPEQIIDLLTLTGDSVDNIPGVPGVGPKTAAQLLQDFGSIEGIFANIDKIKGKRRENLEAARHKVIPLSRQLVTLKSDVELDFELSRMELGPIDGAGLRRVFTELGFRRQIDDLNRLLGGTDTAPAGEPSDAKAQSQPQRRERTTPSPRPAAEGAVTGHDEFSMGLFDHLQPTRTAAPAALAESESAPRPEGVTNALDFDYTPITTQAQLDELVETLRRQPIFAIDTETVGLGGKSKLCGLSIAWDPGHGVYIPVLCPQDGGYLDQAAVFETLRPVLEDPSIAKCGHNVKYDALVLRNAGLRLRGVAFDTMLASHLVGSQAHGLDHLALTLLKHEMIPISRLIGTTDTRGNGERTMDHVPLELITPYAAEDADMALRLYHHFKPQLKLMGMERLADEVEMPLVEVLAEMEFNGIRVDAEELRRQQRGLADRIVELRRQVQDKAGCDFNPDSPKQLAEVLFKRLNLPVIKKTKTGPSTDIEVLETLADTEGLTPEQAAVPRLIVEYRQLTKLVNTYLENLRACIDEKSCRVHASFHQAVTATGRLSSSGPNLQNIPIRTDIGRQIRKAFIADPGHMLISADYSQIELRILAHLSRDERLIEAFEKDLDIHTEVAAQVAGIAPEQVTRDQRAQAKVINFGIIYGVSAFGLARRIEGLDMAGAKKLIAEYKQRFKGIDAFLSRCVQQAMDLSYVTTMMGRRRIINEIHSRNPTTRSLGERLAINSVVQGSAAELIKLAMVSLHRRIEREKLPMRLLLQIHDELVLETPADHAGAMAEIVRHEMESAMKLCVPLKVEVGVGADWLAAK